MGRSRGFRRVGIKGHRVSVLAKPWQGGRRRSSGSLNRAMVRGGGETGIDGVVVADGVRPVNRVEAGVGRTANLATAL